MSETPPPLPSNRMEDSLGARMALPVGRSGWAIASGYLGLFSILLLPAPLALLTGILALREIKKKANTPNPAYGKGRAWFGIIMGTLGMLAMMALIALALLERQ